MHSESTSGDHGANGLRDRASAEVAAFAQQLASPYEEWRSTVQLFREALASLEHLCDAAGATLSRDEGKPQAAASALVDKLLAVAEADQREAIARVRAEAQAETARFEEVVNQLRSDLDAERGRATSASEELERTREDRARDQAAAEDTRRTLEATQRSLDESRAALHDAQQMQQSNQHAIASAEAKRAEMESQLGDARAELEQLKQNLEAEKTARSRLLEALQTVQRAASFAEPSADAPPAKASKGAAKAAASEDKADKAEPQSKKLKLIASKTSANAEIDRELTEYLKQLFEQIQAIYVSDVKASDDSATAVDRLTANLRHAHNVFTRRLESAGAGDPKLFDEQLAALLDAQAETPFGRHLAIAAYNYAPAEAS